MMTRILPTARKPSRRNPDEPVIVHVTARGNERCVLFVDAADYEWLRQYNWTMRSGYATRHENGKVIFMHREIMQAPPGKCVDHYDGCRQNNFRSNLRFCDRKENLRNRPRHMNSHSQFKGVSYCKCCRKWHARVSCEGEYFRSPLFADEADAARAYDRFAVELFGAFAYVNFPEDWPPEKRAEVHAQKEVVQAIRQRRAERAKKARSNKAKVRSEKAKVTRKKAKGKSKK
jgi:hypothetical protein